MDVRIVKNISFLVASSPYPAYTKHCTAWLEQHELPTSESEIYNTVREYTGNANYARLNACLALDYEQGIAKDSLLIKRLQFCISVLPGYKGSGKLMRGVDLSDVEIDRMRSLGEFYIPSFTSTSTGTPFSKSTTLEIEAKDCERITLDIGNSPARSLMTPYSGEAEVLIAPYAKYKFISCAEKEDGKKIVKLKLLDPMSEHGDVLNVYHMAKMGRWEDVWASFGGQPHKAQVYIRYQKPTSGWCMLHQAAWWGNQTAVDTLLQLTVPLQKLGNDGLMKDRRGLTARTITSGKATTIKWS